MMSKTDLSAHDITLTRTLDAPRELVFRAWTDPVELAKWWGPHGFTTPVCRLDLRSGGSLYLEMAGPPGSPWEKPNPMWGEFVEIVPPERLVFTTFLKNAEGTIFLENLNTVTLTENGGKTTLTLEVRVRTALPEAEGPLEGMAEGWSQSLERLIELTASR